MTHHSDKSRGLFWGVLIIVIGFLFLFDEFKWLDIGDLWPLAIIAVGVWLVIKARHRSENNNECGHGMGDQDFITDTDKIFHSNTFGNLRVTINSNNFKGGEVRTVFGDVKVELTNLIVQEGEQLLRLNTTFGNIKISVPKETAFAVFGSNTAGDIKMFDEKRGGWRQTIKYRSEDYETADKKLKIITNQMFGDLKVL